MRLAEVQGLENLQAALAKGRGAIMIGGHFTTIEIATRILGTVVPLNVRVSTDEERAALAHHVHQLLAPRQTDRATTTSAP